MAFDERLAGRVRRILRERPGFSERRIFGGVCFLLGGHLCCGVLEDDLLVRVGPHRDREALALPHARPLHRGGRPVRGFVRVDAEGTRSDPALRRWVRRGVDHAESLPARRRRRTREQREART